MKKRGVTAAVIVVALVLLGIGLRFGLRWNAGRKADSRRAALELCLLGQPLTAGERASGRIRRIGLGEPSGDWPKRCKLYLGEWVGALESAGREALAEEVSAALAEGLETGEFAASASKIDILFESSAARVAAPAGVVAAPAPAVVADESIPGLAAGATLDGLQTDAQPGAQLTVLFKEGELCRFGADIASAACTRVGAKAPTGMQEFALWPRTDDGAPTLISDAVAAHGRAYRFFRADNGTTFDAGNASRAAWAFGYADGSFVTLGPSPRSEAEEGWDLLHWQGKSHGKPVRLDWEAERAVLFGERLLWIARADDDYDYLMTAKLGLEPLSLGKPERLTKVEAVPSDFEACRTEHALALLFSRGADGRVVFFKAGETSPVHSAKLSADVEVPSRVFACGLDDLTLTRVVTRRRERTPSDRIGFIVQYARCTAESCHTQEVDLDQVLKDSPDANRPSGTSAGDVVAAGLGGKLLLIWRSAAGGVRARIAVAGEVASTKDNLVFDDRTLNGGQFEGSTVVKLSLVARRKAAVLLLGVTGSGVRALRIDPDASVTPVTVR